MTVAWGNFMGGAYEAQGQLDTFVAVSLDRDLQRKWLDRVAVLHTAGNMPLEATRYAILRIYGYNPNVVTEADLDLAGLAVGLHVVE